VGSDGRCVGQGVGTAKGSDRSSRGADVCVVQAVDEDWRLGGEVLDQIKHDGGCGEDSCAQAGKRATDRQARRADKGAAASRPEIGETATLGAVNGCAWNIIMGYICTTLHRVTCN
jgi:hypothetical protein